MLQNTLLSRFFHKAHPGFQSGDAGHVQRSGLQPIRQELRHLLLQRLAAGSAFKQRFCRMIAKQKTRPLRAVKPLMSWHGAKRRAQRTKIKRQHPGALRSVHDQRDCRTAAQRGYALDRQHIAEDIGRMRTDHSVRADSQKLLKCIQHCFRREQRRSCNHHLRAQGVKRPCHRIVLVPGNNDPFARSDQTFDRNIQRMRRAGGKDHLLFALRTEHLRRQAAAAEDHLLRRARLSVAAASRRAHRLHRPFNGFAHTGRLLKGGGCAVQIDHGATSRSFPPEESNTLIGRFPVFCKRLIAFS